MNKSWSDRVIIIIANSLSTKTCFIIFCIIAFIPLTVQLPKDILGWQQWISQTAIQLIALNILAIAQKIAQQITEKVSKQESEETRKLLTETHQMVMEELQLQKEEKKLELEEKAKLQELIAEIHKHILNKK